MALRRERASTQLQAFSRGALARRKYVKLREARDDLRRDKVTKIQALARGRAARRSYHERVANRFDNGVIYYTMLDKMVTNVRERAGTDVRPHPNIAEVGGRLDTEHPAGEVEMARPEEEDPAKTEGAPLRPPTCAVSAVQMGRSARPRAVARTVDSFIRRYHGISRAHS